VRYSQGISMTSGDGIRVESCSCNNTSSGFLGTSSQVTAIGLAMCNNSGTSYSSTIKLSKGVAWLVNNQINGFSTAISVSSGRLDLTDLVLKNNDSSGLIGTTSSSSIQDIIVRGLISASNTGSPVNAPCGGFTLINASIAESTPITVPNAGMDVYIRSQHHNSVDNHLLTTDGGTIVSATDQRHTASGISWKFLPTSTTRGIEYPMRLSVAKIACTSGVATTVKIWTRRSSTNIVGRMRIAGGQLAGVAEASETLTPSINTWVQSSGLTFTPTESGVVEVLYECYDGVGTTNSLWIDDLTIA
jgi:hypothetical protein